MRIVGEPGNPSRAASSSPSISTISTVSGSSPARSTSVRSSSRARSHEGQPTHHRNSICAAMSPAWQNQRMLRQTPALALGFLLLLAGVAWGAYPQDPPDDPAFAPAESGGP